MNFFIIFFFITFLFRTSFLGSALDQAEESAKREAQSQLSSLLSRFGEFSGKLGSMEDNIRRLEQILNGLQSGQQSSVATPTNFQDQPQSFSQDQSSQFQGGQQGAADISTNQAQAVVRPGTASRLSSKQKLQNFKTAAIRASVLEEVIKTYLYNDPIITNKLGLNFSGKSQEQLLKEVQANERKPDVKSYDDFYRTAVTDLKPGSVQSNIFADPTTITLIYQRLAMNEQFYAQNSYGLPFSQSSEIQRQTWAQGFVEKQVSRILNQISSSQNKPLSTGGIIGQSATKSPAIRQRLRAPAPTSARNAAINVRRASATVVPRL